MITEIMADSYFFFKYGIKRKLIRAQLYKGIITVSPSLDLLLS